jgi:hypothetical protein
MKISLPSSEGKMEEPGDLAALIEEAGFGVGDQRRSGARISVQHDRASLQ